MTRVLTSICFIAFAAAVAAQSTTAVHRSYDTAFLGPVLPDPVLQHAKETFVLFGCAYCHGLDLVSRGEATDLMHSALVGRDENGSRIGPLLRMGIPQTAKLSPMPQFSDLSDHQINDLVRWIHYARQQGRYRELTTGPVKTGDAAAGKSYFDRACSSCHKVDGDLSGIDRKYDAAALRAAMLEPKQERHHTIVENIGADDVANVVSYLRRGRASASNRPTVTTVSTSFANVAKTGDPNGDGLARWAPFTSLAPQVFEPGKGSDTHRLEGGWVRLDTTGSGSFGGLTSSFARAVLTPAGAARVKPQRDPDDVDPDNKPHKAGEPYIVTQGRCGVGGPGVIEPNSAAFFIVPSRDEVLLVREGPGGRHIYTDGRDHPPLSRIVPSGAGHSTATWEGDDLLVDTIGLAEGAVTAGGWRTPETHVAERYHVAEDGMHLRITFTWTDPKIYARPHSYSFDFERVPADGYAFENWCDSGDPLQRQSVVPPEQLK